jgi:shikimate kinase
VLVGFMGAGKSVVGRELAARLGLPYLDSDEVIVGLAGPVADIFADRGEAGFRAVETDVVIREIEKLAVTPQVFALGGGAVVSGDVRAALRGPAPVVWLTASAEELWRRVRSDQTVERPLARDEQAFTSLLAAREPLYREVATLVVDTGGRGARDVAAEVATLLQTGGKVGGAGRAPKGREEGTA